MRSAVGKRVERCDRILGLAFGAKGIKNSDRRGRMNMNEQVRYAAG